MTTPKSTVYIVDDDPAVRDSLSLMMKQEKIDVLSFDSADAFLNAYQPDYYGCIIIDISMPGMGGLQLQNELSRRGIMLPVIFLTGHGDIPMSVNAIKAGAVDFLTKPVTREKLLTSVRSALFEAKKKMSAVKHNQATRSRIATLTKREREVMKLAAQGCTNKEIASQLGISHRTVEIHRSKIMHKTGAANVIDLAHIAHEAGLIDIFF